ncbi:Hypothetical protein NGAL_HAMBI2605_62820 [Neorhizobium galegae bv. orientalis]|nr:Hypothetical protein NGAL_HAMBI2605_62820 [Neorhizobium galegae bv. orientalis]
MDGDPLGRWARSQPELHARTLEAFILERLDVVSSTAWPLLDRYRLYEVIEACEYLGTWLGNERTFAVPVDQLGNVALGMAALSGDRDDLIAAMRRWFEERAPSERCRRLTFLAEDFDGIGGAVDVLVRIHQYFR